MLRRRGIVGIIAGTLTVIVLLAATGPVCAITRSKALQTASAYASHTWHCSSRNADSTWNDLEANKDYTGVSYNWGGYDTIADFDGKITNAQVAGNAKDFDTIRTEFAGIDCSGFISRCWECGRYTTSSIPSICTPIKWEELKPGDALNNAGSHVRLFESFTQDTNYINVYESTVGVTPGRVVHREMYRSSDYTPLRYKQISDDSTIDTTPPTVTITSGHQNGGVWNTAQKITWKVEDSQSGVRGFGQGWDSTPSGVIEGAAEGWLDLPEGTHTLHINAYDKANNSKDWTFGPFTYNPKGTLTIDTNSNAPGDFKKHVYVNGNDWGIAPQSQQVDAGTYTVTFEDVANWQKPDAQTITISPGGTISCPGTYKDVTPPVINGYTFTPSSPSNASSVQIKVNASDAASGLNRVEVYVDGGLIGNAPLSWDTSGTIEGNHTVRFKAFDNAGLTTETTTTFLVDRTAPTVPSDFTAMGNGDGVSLSWTASSDDKLGVSATSGVSKYIVTRNPVLSGNAMAFDMPKDQTTFTDTTAVYGTAYKYTVRAKDVAGNESGNSNEGSAARGVPGDINADRSVDISDVIKCVRLAIELDVGTFAQRYLGDVNRDQAVDVCDVVKIINLAMGRSAKRTLKKARASRDLWVPVVTGKVGYEIEVPILVSDASDLNGIQVNLKYDPTVLEFTEAANAPSTSSRQARSIVGIGDISVNSREAGLVKLVGYGTTRMTAGGAAEYTVAVMKFKVKRNEVSPLGIERVVVVDTDGDSMPAETPKDWRSTLDPKKGEWATRITAEGNSDYAEAWLGVKTSSSSGSVRNTGMFKPTSSVDLAFAGTNTNSNTIVPVDLRPINTTTMTWDLVISSNQGNEPVHLIWENLSSVPKQYRMTLVDPVTGKRQAMRTGAGGLTCTGGSRYRIEASTRPVGSLRVSGIRCVGSRGTGTQIQFSLSTPADVMVEVRSLVGRTIRTLVMGARAAGVASVQWDGRDHAGRVLPVGPYLVCVAAKSEEGVVVRGAATVVR